MGWSFATNRAAHAEIVFTYLYPNFVNVKAISREKLVKFILFHTLYHIHIKKSRQAEHSACLPFIHILQNSVPAVLLGTHRRAVAAEERAYHVRVYPFFVRGENLR